MNSLGHYLLKHRNAIFSINTIILLELFTKKKKNMLCLSAQIHQVSTYFLMFHQITFIHLQHIIQSGIWIPRANTFHSSRVYMENLLTYKVDLIKCLIHVDETKYMPPV